MSTYTSEPGTRLAGRYRLVHQFSAGAGWTYWKATDETLARPVTVLTFPAGFPPVAETVTAARAARRPGHPRFSPGLHRARPPARARPAAVRRGDGVPPRPAGVSQGRARPAPSRAGERRGGGHAAPGVGGRAGQHRRRDLPGAVPAAEPSRPGAQHRGDVRRGPGERRSPAPASPLPRRHPGPPDPPPRGPPPPRPGHHPPPPTPGGPPAP